MQITDPIADLLTRIRNASTAKHPSVEIPASNMKKAICQILVDEGYEESQGKRQACQIENIILRDGSHMRFLCNCGGGAVCEERVDQPFR